jgi:tRNA(Arg) A34 adenosine deaminase TadA
MDTLTDRRKQFMQRAAELARYAVENDLGGPFGAVVVKNGDIVGEGFNQVTSLNDPTAHAEIMAIRDACRRMGTFQLTGCEIYSSCEPCPMCLGAIYWSRPAKLFYGSVRADAAGAGFDDAFIYDEIALPERNRKIRSVYMPEYQSIEVFRLWMEKENKKRY